MTVYKEIQKFDSIWLKLILVVGLFVPLGFLFYGAYQQLIKGIPFGDNPASDGILIMTIVLLLVFSVVMYFIFFRAQMITEVYDEKITVKFFPLIWTERVYKKEDIESFKVEKYNSLLRFGGWGLRYRSTKEMAINTSGNMGVLLLMKNGKKIMLGSKDTDNFSQALETMLNK